jgi:hypothetical protein
LVETRKGLEPFRALGTVEEVLELQRSVLRVINRLELFPSGVLCLTWGFENDKWQAMEGRIRCLLASGRSSVHD